MSYTRRDFGRLAMAGLPAAAFLHEIPLFGAVLAQAKPNSVINGVTVGTITYSFRSMPDQSAEATLRYAIESGISHIELMGGPVDSYLQPPGRGGRGGGGGGGGAAGRAGAPGAPGAPGGPAAPGAGAPTEVLIGGARGGGGGGGGRGRGAADPATLTAMWNGVPCAPSQPEGARAGGGARGAAPADAAAGAAAGGGGRGGRGGAPQEQTPEQRAAAEQAAKERKAWRESSATMDKVKALRKMYNDAGVQMYAVKNLGINADDEELDFQFIVGKMLGADHITAELPNGNDAATAASLKRVGDRALKHGMYAAYHTHAQGNITVFDTAFAASKGNKANVDFGHYVAGGGGNPVLFLEKFHDRIGSFHLKDRTTPANCALNLPWGTGETPIKELLQTVKKNKWKVPATIELEYSIPQGSDAVKEVRKCLEYCRAALA